MTVKNAVFWDVVRTDVSVERIDTGDKNWLARNTITSNLQPKHAAKKDCDTVKEEPTPQFFRNFHNIPCHLGQEKLALLRNVTSQCLGVLPVVSHTVCIRFEVFTAVTMKNGVV
jgi:hypothetical protein